MHFNLIFICGLLLCEYAVCTKLIHCLSCCGCEVEIMELILCSWFSCTTAITKKLGRCGSSHFACCRHQIQKCFVNKFYQCEHETSCLYTDCNGINVEKDFVVFSLYLRLSQHPSIFGIEIVSFGTNLHIYIKRKKECH